MGRFWPCRLRMADRRECTDRTIVSQCRDRARLAYNGVDFEVKRKFRNKAFQELSELPDVAVSVVVKEENKDSLLGVAVKKK